MLMAKSCKFRPFFTSIIHRRRHGNAFIRFYWSFHGLFSSHLIKSATRLQTTAAQQPVHHMYRTVFGAMHFIFPYFSAELKRLRWKRSFAVLWDMPYKAINCHWFFAFHFTLQFSPLHLWCVSRLVERHVEHIMFVAFTHVYTCLAPLICHATLRHTPLLLFLFESSTQFFNNFIDDIVFSATVINAHWSMYRFFFASSRPFTHSTF